MRLLELLRHDPRRSLSLSIASRFYGFVAETCLKRGGVEWSAQGSFSYADDFDRFSIASTADGFLYGADQIVLRQSHTN